MSNGPSQVPQPNSLPTSHRISPTDHSKKSLETDFGMANLRINAERANGRPELSAIRMRNLHRNTTQEELKSMLLFAKDVVGVEFTQTDLADDQGHKTAVARFRSPEAAQEASKLLHGKQNGASETRIIVEILRLSPTSTSSRKVPFDMANHRTNSYSSATSASGVTRQSSRYNGTFHSMDRISPPNGIPNMSNSTGTAALNDGQDLTSPRPNIFSSQSPVDQRQRVSGKSVIDEDGADEEPSDLLNDPLGYANGHHAPGPLSRQSNASNISTAQYRLPALTTGSSSIHSSHPPPMAGFTPPRTAGGLQSPTGPLSPTASMSTMSPTAKFNMSNNYFTRQNYPPVNPADQNPPCNTLYVGNLPIDTAEEELKGLFSKQRGYKRLCVRTKHNGPMCFVEFEDVTAATKALHDLYGHPLHNSVRGGIRLSFSKNPLGVRNGQPGSMIPPSPMSPTNVAGGGSIMNGVGGFSTAHGPPPGIPTPPGLGSPNGHLANYPTSPPPYVGLNGMMSPNSNIGYGMNHMGMPINGRRSPPPPPPSQANPLWGAQYDDQNVGRYAEQHSAGYGDQAGARYNGYTYQ